VWSWVIAMNACLSPPIVVPPGGEHTASIYVHENSGGVLYPDRGRMVESGTYRLVWTGVLTAFDPNARGFGPQNCPWNSAYPRGSRSKCRLRSPPVPEIMRTARARRERHGDAGAATRTARPELPEGGDLQVAPIRIRIPPNAECLHLPDIADVYSTVGLHVSATRTIGESEEEDGAAFVHDVLLLPALQRTWLVYPHYPLNKALGKYQPGMSGPREFLLANLPLIEQIVASICRRKGMNPDEIDEFAAVFKLRLVDNDYAVIRAFRERSSFATYIAAVIGKALLDHRNREWGKWRASAEAERLGDIAIKIERRLYRDQSSLDDAFVAIVSQHPELTRPDFDRLAEKLPVRWKRRHVELDEALLKPEQPDVTGPEVASAASTISRIVCGFIDRLPEEDQLLLRMRFDSEMSVAQIAMALHLDQQLLYRRLYRHFDDLRGALEAAGVRAGDVADVMGKETNLLDFHFKSRGTRPSEEDESTGRAGRRKGRHDR
jgi:RNA polymerase sigma factor for flagellar operon FliA